MEIITDTKEFYIEKETAVAIGKFDGVHLGHRRLLDEILRAKDKGLLACVFTFDPPPSVLFGGDPHVILDAVEKRRIFERMGIDILVEFPMNAQTASTPPAEFITEYLVNQMNTRMVVAGPDVSFGDKGAGNANLLKSMSKECGYEVILIDKVCVSDGTEISSSVIRKCIEQGNMERAEMMLGGPYSISGIIEHGNHLGHTLGFPTINIYPTDVKILPPYGVYSSDVIISGKFYKGVSNIGSKPTVNDTKQVSVETYLYDTDEDLYGKEAEVRMLRFCRPETKFSGIDELKAQLEKDIEFSRPRG